MMKKRLLAFISIILLLVSFFPSSVFAVEARSSISAHDFTTSLEPLESISLEKYNTLLMAWSTIPHIPSDRYANFPSFFGGAYIDENKELVIQVTDNNSDIMEYFAELIDLENVRFQTAENSLAELLEIKYELNKRISSNTSDPLRLSAQDSLIDGTGISIPNNSVNLYDASSGQSNRIPLEEAVLTTCYAESGDSGGLVASHGNTSRGYVVGIVSGGIIPRNGNNQMYYAKVSPILYKLDLNVW
ncbi:MAG: S1 family peptidase [Oscillibacter sp.]|nr:S1 family peptidase [Oscillibacter sp.]